MSDTDVIRRLKRLRGRSWGPVTSTPTPIFISRRMRTVLVVVAVALLIALLWHAPSVLMFSLGGAALAIVLSFPVRVLSRWMPRSLAILITFLLVAAIAIAAFVGMVPVLTEQLSALINAVPGIAQRFEDRLPALVEGLAERGLLPISVDEFIGNLKQDLLGAIENFARRLLGGIGPLVAGAVNVAIALFGIVFIAAYLLADARKLHGGVLRQTPHRYRRDVRDLWNAFGFTLSRYLGGLAISLFVQGALSAVALYMLGVPYALLLGTWVALTALVPYIGAWIGAVPAVLLAFSISPGTAVLTALLFLLIQQLEGNVLTPRLQGVALRVHPVIVFLAVVVGGELAGLVGVIFAVPTLAVLRVLFDFFRARLHVAAPLRPLILSDSRFDPQPGQQAHAHHQQ